jgi:hypothetical protein
MKLHFEILYNQINFYINENNHRFNLDIIILDM